MAREDRVSRDGGGSTSSRGRRHHHHDHGDDRPRARAADETADGDSPHRHRRHHHHRHSHRERRTRDREGGASSSSGQPRRERSPGRARKRSREANERATGRRRPSSRSGRTDRGEHSGSDDSAGDGGHLSRSGHHRRHHRRHRHRSHSADDAGERRAETPRGSAPTAASSTTTTTTTTTLLHRPLMDAPGPYEDAMGRIAILPLPPPPGLTGRRDGRGSAPDPRSAHFDARQAGGRPPDGSRRDGKDRERGGGGVGRGSGFTYDPHAYANTPTPTPARLAGPSRERVGEQTWSAVRWGADAPGAPRSPSLSSSSSREDGMDTILETAEQARERRRQQQQQQQQELAAGLLSLGVATGGWEGGVDGDSAGGQDGGLPSLWGFPSPSTLAHGAEAVDAIGRYAALSEVQQRRVQYQAMKGLLSSDAAPASRDGVVRVALYGVDLSVTEDHLESLAAQLLGEAPWRVRRPVRELLHHSGAPAHDRQAASDSGAGAAPSRTPLAGAPEGYLEEEDEEEELREGVGPTLEPGAVGLLGESATVVLRRTVVGDGATAAAAATATAQSFLFLPGLYDPDGAGGMVVMEFQRATTAARAVEVLNGARINGRYTAASLVEDAPVRER